MLTAKTEKNEIVIAHNAVKGLAFFCPECHSSVILKQSKIITPHFAHKPPVTCYYGKDESEAHLNAKNEIYNALKHSNSVASVELEKSFGDVRCDICAEINGFKVAIEV